MNKYKISNISFSFIFICLLNSSLLGIIFPYILNESKTSFYISLGISYFIGLFLIFIFLKIFNFLPDKDIFKKIDYVFPKIIAKIISVILYLLVFVIVLIIFWRLVTFISSEFLVETPNLFIASLLAAPLIYLLFYDFDVIARLATFCFFIGFCLLFFNVISLTSQIDFNNLKPLLNTELIHLSKSSIIFISIFLLPAFLTLIIPKNNILNNEKIGKSILISYTFSFFSIAFVFFTIISVLGIDIALLYTFPSYVVLKTMNVLSFVHNIENISILIWVLFMTFSSGFCLLFLKTGLANIFNFKEKKLKIASVLIIFIPFMSLVLYMLPYEIFLNKYKFVYFPALIYGTCFILFIIIYIIGKVKLKFKAI